MRSFTGSRFLQIASFITVGFGSLASIAFGQRAASATTSKPNLVVILVDDMGFSDIGCYGSEISTPNLDKLASQSLRLRQFYNAGRCCPTRASVLTGLYAHEAGVGHMVGGERPLGPYQGFLNHDCVTFAQALKPAGYETIMVGKWHVGWGPGQTPWDRGFDHSYCSQAGGFYYPTGIQRGKNVFLDGKDVASKPSDLPADWYSTDAWTDHAMTFVDGAVSDHKPFCLYLAFNAPHFPIQAPADLVEKYRGHYLTGWEPLRSAREDRQKKMGLVDADSPLTKPEDDVPEWNSLMKPRQQRYDGMMASYAADVERMDYNVGRLVDHLKSTGQFDNTLLLFLSDNGGNAESGVNGRSENVQQDRWGGPDTTIFIGKCWATLNNTPFRKFKHFVHEGGISSPLIMSWPARMDTSLKGQIVTGTGHIVDILPTLLDAGGGSYPTTFEDRAIHAEEGTSLLPLLANKSLDREKPIWWEHEGNAAIREGNLKLVRIQGGSWELYDIAKDRVEENDLSKSRPDDLKKLSADWQAIADRVGVQPWSIISKQFKDAPAPAARPEGSTTGPAPTSAPRDD